MCFISCWTLWTFKNYLNCCLNNCLVIHDNKQVIVALWNWNKSICQIILLSIVAQTIALSDSHYSANRVVLLLLNNLVIRLDFFEQNPHLQFFLTKLYHQHLKSLYCEFYTKLQHLDHQLLLAFLLAIHCWWPVLKEMASETLFVKILKEKLQLWWFMEVFHQCKEDLGKSMK